MARDRWAAAGKRGFRLRQPTCVEHFVADRQVGQFVQLVQLAEQAVQVWAFEYLAGVVQPGLDTFDAR